MTGEASNLYRSIDEPDKHNRILPSERTSTAINAARRANQSSALTSPLMGPVVSAEPGVHQVTSPAVSPSARFRGRRATGGWFTNWKAITPFEALGRHAVSAALRVFRLRRVRHGL
jgi:hypothetical protein